MVMGRNMHGWTYDELIKTITSLKPFVKVIQIWPREIQKKAQHTFMAHQIQTRLFDKLYEIHSSYDYETSYRFKEYTEGIRLKLTKKELDRRFELVLIELHTDIVGHLSILEKQLREFHTERRAMQAEGLS